MPITATDIIFLLFLLFFVAQGYEKGFLRSVLGPVSLVICFLGAIMYFNMTRNTPVSLTIIFLGPTILHFLLKQAFGAAKRLEGTEEAGGRPTNPGSQMFGAVFNALWGGGMILLVIFTLSILPFNKYGLDRARADIYKSQTFRMIYPWMNHFELTMVKSPDDFKKKVESLNFKNPVNAQAIAKSQEYQDVLADDSIAALLTDPDIQQAIENNNYVELIKHPAIMEIAQDPDKMKKIMGLYKTFMEQASKEAESLIPQVGQAPTQ